MRFIFIPLLLLFLAGCAAGGITADFAKQAPPHAAGTLALYRDGNSLGLTTYVLIDGRLIGAVGYRQVLRVPLSSGLHHLTVADAALSIPIASGQLQNVLLSLDFWGNWHLYPLSSVQAETWARDAIDVSGKILPTEDLPDLNAPQN